jgi:hypothetical protein
VVNTALSGQQAGVLGLVMLVVAVALRWRATGRLALLTPWVQEISIVALLYSLWQLAGSANLIGPSGAIARGEWILRFERGWLPSEHDVQNLILPHPLLAQACNLYYDTMHFTLLGVLLVWLFLRHRASYPPVRTTLVLVTSACLIIQFLPVAPPRLVPSGHFVDVAEQYHQSVYVAFSDIVPGQVAAMPSVHVAWAMLVGLTVVQVSTSRWRWLALLHPAITIFVVVATANHWWLDGLVAIALLLLSMGGQWLTRRWWQRRRIARPGHESVEPALPAGVGAD